MPIRRGPTPFDALPDAVLGSILALAGRENGPAMALTCRRWRAALFSADAAELWGRLKVDATEMAAQCATPAERVAWMRARLAHLALVGPLASYLLVRETSGGLEAAARSGAAADWSLPRLLDSLSPSRLHHLALALNPWALPPSAVQRLGARFPHLANLSLTTLELPGAAAVALTGLAQLRSLACACMRLPPELVPALCALSQLTSLDVTSVGLPSEVTHLTCLRLLRHLALHCHAPAPPAAALAAPATGLEVPLPAALPALEFFDYSADRGMQVAGALLKSAKYQVGPAAANGPFAPGRQVATLALGHVSRLQPQAGLARLLDALLPDSAPLDCLLLEHCALSAPALRDCPRLAALPAMTLRHCSDGGIAAAFGGDTELGPALEQLLGQAASLTALELQGRLDYGGLPTLPRALVEKAGIRWLRLRHNYLEELPAGPWLQSLETLEIGDINLAESRELPQALEGAPALRRLCLATNSKVPVRRIDVGLLSSLPSLAFLSVGVRLARGVRAALLEAVPNLELVEP